MVWRRKGEEGPDGLKMRLRQATKMGLGQELGMGYDWKLEVGMGSGVRNGLEKACG